MPRLRIESVRARLTLFWVAALAAVLLVVGGLIYALLARALYSGIDESLTAAMPVAVTSLRNDLNEGQDYEDAARSTAAELSSPQLMIALYDDAGRLLAEGGRDNDLKIQLPALDTLPIGGPVLVTVHEPRDDDDRHRLAIRRVLIEPHDVRYVVVVGAGLERTDEELESLRDVLAYVVPLALVLAGLGGWFLARQTLGPVAAMSARARRIGAGDTGARLQVVNPRDEIGALAQSFNDLLDRLEVSLAQQRQFMADASHELRTPVTTVRTAAAVALQQPHRPEAEYREALALVEQQATNLSRIVQDMFTLARADAGSYPVRRMPLYLDEIVEEVVRAARVVAATRTVAIEVAAVPSAAFTGDEDLLRRLIENLVGNAVAHAGTPGVVQVTLTSEARQYVVTVSDNGPGIPLEAQPHIFERFYRADVARSAVDGGAGLGLALARWIARVHDGDVTLIRSSAEGTTFGAVLPHDG